MKKEFAIYVIVLFVLFLLFFFLNLPNVGKFDLKFFSFLLMGLGFEIVGFSIFAFSKHKVRLTGGIIADVLAACFLPVSQTMLVAISAVVFSGLVLVRSRDPLKYLFNASQIGLSAGLAALLFQSLSIGKSYLDIWFVLLVSGLYIVLNTVFISIGYTLIANQTLTKSFSVSLKGPLTGTVMIIPVILSTYVLYYFLELKAIPLVFIIFLAVQLGNFFRTEYVQSRFENLKLLVKSLEMKDYYTSGHSERAAMLSYQIAKKLGLPESSCERIKDACLLHDVGKIGIPDYILNKPDKLTSEEFQIIKTHPIKSEELLKTVAKFKNKEARWVRYHHEQWDGNGYPDGLMTDKIPLESRIIAAADIYEALTSDRPYRKAYTRDDALKLIQEMAGTVLDPTVATALIKVISEGLFENGKETK